PGMIRKPTSAAVPALRRIVSQSTSLTQPHQVSGGEGSHHPTRPVGRGATTPGVRWGGEPPPHVSGGEGSHHPTCPVGQRRAARARPAWRPEKRQPPRKVPSSER